MELEWRDFRAIIYYDFLRDLSASQSLTQLNCFWRSRSISLKFSTGFAEFRRGRASLFDEERLGRPATAVTPDNLAKVKKIIV